MTSHTTIPSLTLQTTSLPVRRADLDRRNAMNQALWSLEFARLNNVYLSDDINVYLSDACLCHGEPPWKQARIEEEEEEEIEELN